MFLLFYNYYNMCNPYVKKNFKKRTPKYEGVLFI